MRLRLSGNMLSTRRVAMGWLLLLAAGLQIAAGVGLAYVAGFNATHAALVDFHWVWLPALVGGLVISFVGYYYAYRGVYRVDDGPTLTRAQMRAVVAAGFGGFLAHGGPALDDYALQAAGADEREAKVRVSSLAGLEHGILGLGGCGAAIAILILGLPRPTLDFTLPWAVIPVPGFFIAFWLAGRYRARMRDRAGWRGRLGVFLDSIYLIREMFVKPLRRGDTLAGMAVYWAADIFAAWAGLAAFGVTMNGAQFIVGFATGLVFTRRTGPLGGAGVLELVLPVTIWYSGAPFAAAIVGIFVYRVLILWLPLPFALSSLDRLRTMGNEDVPYAEQRPQKPAEPALRDGDD